MYTKKTKIVCTIGPSSWDQDVMRRMIEAGMNVARVNGAFADEAELDKVTDLVRNVSNEVALMMDVKGPEVRMNKFSEPIAIKPGDKIEIGNTPEDHIYPANYKDLYKNLKPGQRVVIGDGDVELKIEEITGDKMQCVVVFGEMLKPGKAMNLPGAEYTSEALTEKDIVNLKHAIKLGWDFVSASFIQNAAAAKKVNEYLKGSHMKLIAKIEDKQGVDNIDEILQEVEGIMIARGGLGVELGLENVPMVQRYLTEKCNAVGKPVITATQMLESMTYNPRPTRAEVNDVALAILLGSDAVMLSGESSAGKYPVETVMEMSKIAKVIEPHLRPEIMRTKAQGPSMTDALTKAVAELCMNLDNEIDVVLVASMTGRTARLLGRHKIKQPIYAFASQDYYARLMMLSKGINRTFVISEGIKDRDKALNSIIARGMDLGIIKPGQKALVVSKPPVGLEVGFFPNLFELVTVSEQHKLIELN